MKITKRSIVIPIAAAFALIVFTACGKDGPAEEAGQKIDDAAEEVGDKVEEATD